ncbi:MAG TPA: nitrite reductase large subunit NirB [Mycobacteriales bacterium]|nr:nitrite reductase large subunit NirB [Mycobacteriales bacterium]
MKQLVVVGHGMVGHRLVEAIVDRGGLATWSVTVVGEEPRPAYDRVALTSYFTDATAEDLCLVPGGFFEADGLTLRTGTKVVGIDRPAQHVILDTGERLRYDALVLATGSYPFVPPIDGRDGEGCFVYRTIEDLDAIRGYAESRRTGLVIGGGLLGLEAANALRSLGLYAHVVEMAPRLMPLQVDGPGGELLRHHIVGRGVEVHTGVQTSAVLTDDSGAVRALQFADGSEVETELVVFSAGIRPRDELARQCGLDVHERGGVLVDEACRTSDPAVFAIGEVAVAAGRVYGLVAPGYAMAEVVADRLLGGDGAFTGADMSTKLKLMGVDVASFGDAFATAEGAQEVTFTDSVAGVYKKLVVDATGSVLLGGILVGDASTYSELRALVGAHDALPERLEDLLVPPRAGGAERELPAAAVVCSCHNVTKQTLCDAIARGQCELAGLKRDTKAGTGCGSCSTLVKKVLDTELTKAGLEVSTALCEHFTQTRAELDEIVRRERIGSFADLVARHGTGRGCDICKPVVASILAIRTRSYILDGEQAGLQDTNDHMLANLQKDGTYSVVPRLPGGEVTPEKLIAIGEVARDFGLYTKVTGGQRIDLFGAHAEQLPAIWQRLVAAGMESGHAYGKALRTVKSCVGNTWCRYGVQDSVAMAVDLELRYRGLRAPHKIKMAVSGCARECAEARSKDVGVIATEKGWNLYVCGNGGAVPRHADLLAADLSSEELVQAIDRFLGYYLRTGMRLERTSTWLERIEGGLDHVRAVVFDDVLGIHDELDAEMAAHIRDYRDEWAETLADPQRLARFTRHVNLGSRIPVGAP